MILPGNFTIKTRNKKDKRKNYAKDTHTHRH